MNCGVGCRLSSDPAFLWLWYRPAAVALIGLLAWELPYGAGAALKKKKKKKKAWYPRAKRMLVIVASVVVKAKHESVRVRVEKSLGATGQMTRMISGLVYNYLFSLHALSVRVLFSFCNVLFKYS